MKCRLIFTHFLAASVCCFGQTPPEKKDIPYEIVQKTSELDARLIFHPAPYKRVAAIKFFEKGKSAGQVCELTDQVAKELVGETYSNVKGKTPILVSWHYLEEETIDLKYSQASSGPPVVRIFGDSVYVQAQHHDILKKGEKVECPIVILVDKVPAKAALYSKTIGW